MAQQLNQVPPNLEVWRVDGRSTYLVRLVPDTDPPIPLVWGVTSSEDGEALGIDGYDRELTSEEFYKTGPIRSGTSRELLNTTEDPWQVIQSNYETEVKVKPWLADDEVLAKWLGAALEGRSLTEAELQGTDWWRTHTESERQWLALNASDPATAEQLIDDNRTRVADMFRSAGIDNASEDLIQTVADRWTTGAWSQIYATKQIELLSDPNLAGTLDPALTRLDDGLDTTRQGEDEVENMLTTWLGPNHGWGDDHIAGWASKLRQDPDARLELEDVLKRHRLALYPEYENANLTYEDIAAPWRGVFQQQWGQLPDESDALFQKVVRLNDRAQAEKVLREEGLKRGNQTVANRLLSDLQVFGGQVRRSL